MNCSEALYRMHGMLYGDLDAATTETIRSHLASCQACRLDYAALQQVRGALHLVAAPAVQVDLPRLFQAAAARQTMHARRWRRAAVAACGLAAGLLLVVLLRLEARVEANQLTVRWGALPREETAQGTLSPERIIAPEEPGSQANLEDRLRILDELLHAVITDIADRDNRQSERLARLQDHLETLRMQNGRRWSETERNVAAMRTALFVLPQKGERP